MVGVEDPGATGNGTPAQRQASLGALSASAAAVVRIAVGWSSIAPAGTQKPAGFNASDPADPHYRWSSLDDQVRYVAQHHRQIVIFFTGAPRWAEGPGLPSSMSPGTWNPNPHELAAFAHAVASRYSGEYPDPVHAGAGLPRVRYWEPWNEPNIPGQYSSPNRVRTYRALLNAAYPAIKSVHPDNRVALGGLAPVSVAPGANPPLSFAAALLCLHRAGGGYRPNRRCPERVHFDALAIHPYSFAATPTKHAYKPGDVLVADMGKVAALVHAANRWHTALPASGHGIWVTEFAWFTRPPNVSLGDPQPVAARYVSYAMYEMWRAGSSMVIWLSMLDTPSFSGAGLYTRLVHPKLTLRAFSFPVIASVKGKHGYVWGRAPVNGSVRVRIQRKGRRWRTLTSVRTGSDGVFTAHIRAHGNGSYRAQVIGGPTSLGYNSRPIPPKRIHAGV
jgi:hypothetical protein